MIILNLSNAATFQWVPINSVILYIKKITACEQNNLKYIHVSVKITLKYPFRNNFILCPIILRELFDRMSTYICYLYNLQSLILSKRITSNFEIYSR